MQAPADMAGGTGMPAAVLSARDRGGKADSG